MKPLFFLIFSFFMVGFVSSSLEFCDGNSDGTQTCYIKEFNETVCGGFSNCSAVYDGSTSLGSMVNETNSNIYIPFDFYSLIDLNYQVFDMLRFKMFFTMPESSDTQFNVSCLNTSGSWYRFGYATNNTYVCYIEDVGSSLDCYEEGPDAVTVVFIAPSQCYVNGSFKVNLTSSCTSGCNLTVRETNAWIKFSGKGLGTKFDDSVSVIGGGSITEYLEAWNPTVYHELDDSFEAIWIVTTFEEFPFRILDFTILMFKYVLRQPASLSNLEVEDGES